MQLLKSHQFAKIISKLLKALRQLPKVTTITKKRKKKTKRKNNSSPMKSQTQLKHQRIDHQIAAKS